VEILHASFCKVSKPCNNGISLNWSRIDEVNTAIFCSQLGSDVLMGGERFGEMNTGVLFQKVDCLGYR